MEGAAGGQPRVCPGMRLATTDACAAGAGTYVFEGGVYASVVGVQRRRPGAAGAPEGAEGLQPASARDWRAGTRAQRVGCIGA